MALLRWDMGYWECPSPITEVSATGLPSPASWLGSARDNSDGGDSVWLLLLGYTMGWGASPKAAMGIPVEGRSTPQAGSPSLYWPCSCSCLM